MMEVNMKVKHKRAAFLVLWASVICIICFTGTAEANTTANFPWDSALKQLADSLPGPVAFSLGLFMIVWCAQIGIESVIA